MIDNDFTVGRPVRVYDHEGYFSDLSTEEVVAKRINNFSGWKCAAGIENINIDFDGFVQLASCGVGTRINKTFTGTLGNVYDGYLIIPDNWIDCNIKACSCGADMFIPKYDPKRSGKQYLRKLLQKPPEKDKYLGHNAIGNNTSSAVERTHLGGYKQVFWEMGRRCNFNCSYCPSEVHNNTEKKKSWDQLNDAYQLIKDKFLLGSKANFVVSGGEPTVHKNYIEFAEMVYNDGHKLSTHSNGSRLPKYYRELIHYSDLNISIHFEYIDRYEEKISNIIEGICQEKILRDNQGKHRGHMEVYFMVMPGRLEEAIALEKDIIQTCPEFLNYCTHTFMPLRTNEIIQQVKQGIKKDRQGNELLIDYTSEEMNEMGSRTEKCKNEYQ